MAWNKTIDNIEKYRTKNKEVPIIGKLTTHSSEDKEGMTLSGFCSFFTLSKTLLKTFKNKFLARV
ncbi:MAG: hypothetical protein P8N05_00370 [Polaribacter sp.]|nr:hypothetical protein [Polaribacter sp.]